MTENEIVAYGWTEHGTYRHFPPFLRLFRYEFEELLDDPDFYEDFRGQFDRFYPTNTKRAIERQAAERKVEVDARSRLPVLDPTAKKNYFRGMFKVPDEECGYWHWFQDRLIKYAENDAWLKFMLTNRPEPERNEDGEEVEHFDRFFPARYPKLLDWCADFLSPEPLVQHLDRMNVEVYEELVIKNYVKPMMEMKPNERDFWARELLRRLFYAKPGEVANKQRSWFWDFMYACSQSPANTSLLRHIDEEYEYGLGKYVFYVEKRVKNLLTDDMDNYVGNENFFSTVFRPQKANADIVYMEDAEDVPPLELRSYQMELARHANAGMNTLICAPTGSGKTIVALDIIIKHFQRNLNEYGQFEEKSRVVFIVPSVPLVLQQQKLIQRYVSSNYSVQGFYGGDGQNANERLGAILRAHIVVITPQLLVNMLKSVFKSERLYIADFTLMIFDECHHCAENHSYHVVMKHVQEYKKHVEGKPDAQPPPQIVGLTASLGTGKTSFYADPSMTERHMLELCVRMMAEQISTVHQKECLEELERYVNPPIDTIESVRRPRNDRFVDLIHECVRSIAMLVSEHVDAVKQRVPDLGDFRLPDTVDGNYVNLVERLYESSGRWPEDVIGRKALIVTAIDNLRIYLHALRVNDLLPTAYAFQYVHRRMTNFENAIRAGGTAEEGELLDGLTNIYKDRKDAMLEVAREEMQKEIQEGVSSKEILEKLIQILNEEYTKNPDTRTMIFVEQRATTHALAEFLGASDRLRKHFDDNSVRALTSTNQSSKLGGMSNPAQKAVIHNFTKGVVKALVVTSVAEEGMDISACNLIIKYNVVGSERTMIQRRGRARALHSRSVLLALDDGVQAREIDNMNRERMMHTCLKNLQSKSESQLAALIAETKRRLEVQARYEASQTAEKHRQFSDFTYNVQCTQCDAALCDSRDLRVINDTYYVCVKPEVWNRIKIGNSDTPQAPSANGIAANCSPFSCKCGKQLGAVISFSSIFLPAFACGKLTFREKHNKMDAKSNISWVNVKDTLFQIPDCSQQNLIDMASSLQNWSVDEYDKMREQMALALQIQVEAIKRKRQRKNRFTLAEYEDS